MRGKPGKCINDNGIYLGRGINHIVTQLIDETQLIEFVDDISKSLQEGQQTDILILDFAKAFDKVNHSLLIHKLQHSGIIGKSVRWIQNWLANRKQSVVIDGSTSDAVSVDSGVPQGSHLGPGLFLYYITDLQSRLTSTVVRLFADDR